MISRGRLHPVVQVDSEVASLLLRAQVRAFSGPTSAFLVRLPPRHVRCFGLLPERASQGATHRPRSHHS